MNEQKKLNDTRAFRLISSAAVPLLFLVISGVAIPLAQFSGVYLVSEIITRLSRDSFLVLSLLLPVMAGMGINFGMILGAMAGQIGLVFVTDWGMAGVNALLIAALIGTPISIALGWFGGIVLNKSQGREMITSMMLGLFVTGLYQFFLLYMCGDSSVMPIALIPLHNSKVVLSKGFGVRNGFELAGAGSLDKLWRLRFPFERGIINVPIATFLVVGAICLFLLWFRKTKLGQDMRAVGLDKVTSGTSGINVNKVRIQSIILSTVLACYGQIIYLQNMGTLNTYNGADQAALFAAAALLVGGATVSKASIANALVGTGLFHLMFVVM
ncbi:MAG: ABC transporter permease, partial [Peptococcaceae bacterium]|nr:ABC transporter permease [Peptococcaceae bacterium]